MKLKFLMSIFLVVLSFHSYSKESMLKLMNAISMVESCNNDNAVGDNGNAVGRFQIWKIVIDDVNQIIGSNKFKYEDRKDCKKSMLICYLYLKHYALVYEKKTGKKATNEVMARMWNGGPGGWGKDSTKKYWNKVKRYL